MSLSETQQSVNGAENWAERVENRVSGSGELSGWQKTNERGSGRLRSGNRAVDTERGLSNCSSSASYMSRPIGPTVLYTWKIWRREALCCPGGSRVRVGAQAQRAVPLLICPWCLWSYDLLKWCLHARIAVSYTCITYMYAILVAIMFTRAFHTILWPYMYAIPVLRTGTHV